MNQHLPRRELLKQLAAGAIGASVLGSGLLLSGAASAAPATAGALKGNIRHSVSRWTYGDLSMEELCLLVKSLGFSAIDLVGPEDWPVLKKHGVDSSMSVSYTHLTLPTKA